MLTEAIRGLDVEILTQIGLFIHNPIIFGLLLLLFLFLGEKRDNKRMMVVLALLLTGMSVAGLKGYFGNERPCVNEGWCPPGYSFPSNHAALAFTLMIAFMDKKNYIFYLIFALFVSFTRINLGVHRFYDIVSALPIAFLSYYIVRVFWKGEESESMNKS